MDHSRYEDHDTSTTPETVFEDTTPQSQLDQDEEYERERKHKSGTTDAHSHNSSHWTKGY